MLLLTATTDKLQIVTSAAVQTDVHVSYMDLSGTTVTPGRQNTTISTATTTDIVAAPGASTTRNIKEVLIHNCSATTTQTVSLLFNQNSTVFDINDKAIKPGETYSYAEGAGWVLLTGASGPPMAYSTAAQTANAADTYITGSVIALPTGVALKAGTILRWRFVATKTAAGTATPIWSIRFGSGVIGDTARHTLTGVAQTAAADTAFVDVQVIVRSVGGSGVTHAVLKLDHALAATGFANVAHSVIQNTSSAFDTTAVTGIGISVNPGTAGVWTLVQATAEALNL